MAYPSLTHTQHHDTYASINPMQTPELSLKGKTVFITGAGTGIGRGLTHAFADAGAKTIAILGRRKDKLEETKRLVEESHRGTSIVTHSTDVTDMPAVQKAAKAIGPWDVLVSNAGYLSKPHEIVGADGEEWWKSFEVRPSKTDLDFSAAGGRLTTTKINVKGIFNLAQAFLPTKKDGASLVSINAGSIQVPRLAPKLSAYNSSKFALLKIVEALGAENPDLHVVSMHPGVVESEMTAASGVLHVDTPILAGHFAVWLCSKEASFLRGRFVWCNWDVEELKAKKEAFENDPLLTTGNCIGWPYTP